MSKDTFLTDDIVCPYCGHGLEEWWSVLDAEQLSGTMGEIDMKCDGCRKEFLVEVDVRYRFTTTKPCDDEEEDEQDG